MVTQYARQVSVAGQAGSVAAERGELAQLRLWQNGALEWCG